MKTTVITSGNFAKTGDKNFTGYTAGGDKYFIHRNIMDRAGIKTDADANKAFPFHVNVGTTMINPTLRDETGKAIGFSPVKEARESVLAVFLTIQDAVKANSAEFEFQAELAKAKKAIAVASELDDETISLLLSNSFA